jgi:DNA-binding Xre family transcriptional regulator
MAVSYNKLWKLLIDKKIKRTELMELSGISTNVLAKLGHDESVSMDSIAKVCKVLNCDIGEVMEITSDD